MPPIPDNFMLRAKPRGFTLLEVLLAMAILVVLVGGLAGITSASLRLGRNILETQQEDSVRDGFERLLRENLAEIPQDCPVVLQADNSNNQMVILGKASGMFPVSGLPLVTQSVALETRRARSGSLALWFVYYAGDLIQAQEDDSVDTTEMVQIPFKDGLEKLQWQVYDAVNDETLDEWKERGRRPHYLEMIYRFAGDVADHRMVFWLPRLQSSPTGNQTPGTDGGDADAGGNQPGTVEIPGNRPGGGGRPGDSGFNPGRGNRPSGGRGPSRMPGGGR